MRPTQVLVRSVKLGFQAGGAGVCSRRVQARASGSLTIHVNIHAICCEHATDVGQGGAGGEGSEDAGVEEQSEEAEDGEVAEEREEAECEELRPVTVNDPACIWCTWETTW